MKKTIYILAAICAMMACAKGMETPVSSEEPKDKIQDNENLVTVTVGVKMDDAATKVVIGEDGTSRYLKWKDGDYVSVGFTYLDGDKVGQYDQTDVRLTVDGTSASFTYTYDPTKRQPADVHYPRGGKQSSVPTTQYFWRGDVIIPLIATFDGSQANVTFAPISEIGDNYSIIKYNLTSTVAKSLSSIKVTFNGGTTYTLDTEKTQSGTEPKDLQGETKTFFVVIPSASTEGELKSVFTMSDKTEYTRIKKTFTPTAKHVHALPTITIDNTGNHFWNMKNVSGGGSTESHFKYWFAQETHNMTGISYSDAGLTVTLSATDGETKKKFNGKVTPAWPQHNDNGNIYYCADGTSVYNSATDGFFKVHAGNYPVFAMKTNIGTLGSSRELILDLNSSTNNSANTERYTSNNLQFVVGSGDLAGIIYYDLLARNIKVGSSAGLAPTTKAMNLTGWSMKFQNITYATAQDPAPTYIIEWAGFFNSIEELKDYVKDGTRY